MDRRGLQEAGGVRLGAGSPHGAGPLTPCDGRGAAAEGEGAEHHGEALQAPPSGWAAGRQDGA
eukprot:10786810-Alexandrium_andersonii.AAC.1